MKKKIIGLIVFLVVLIAFLGLGTTLEIVGSILNLVFVYIQGMNKLLFEILGESFLSIVFKHYLTYTIVGLIMSSAFAGLGIWLGKTVGKILYILVGFGAVAFLNFIAALILG